MKRLLVLIFLPAIAYARGAPDQVTNCISETNAKPIGYCVTITNGSTNPDTIFYLHGAGLEQDAWTSAKEPIWQYWSDHGIQAPTIITLGFGPIFLLAQKNQAKASGLLEFVADKYIPKIEKDLGGLKGRRLLLGESMGGFSAIQLAMKRPSMFAKIALNCPDIMSIGPYATDAEKQTYMDTTGADAQHTWWELYMERIFFANDGSWNDASPLIAGPRYLGAQTPPFFLSGSLEDQFGFFPGTLAFLKIAQDQGVNVQWAPVPGAHCSYDIEKVSEFLTN